MDKMLLQKRLRGWAEFNEWKLQKDREKLSRLTVEQSVRQFVDLCRLARRLAPDASEIFVRKTWFIAWRCVPGSSELRRGLAMDPLIEAIAILKDFSPISPA